MRPAKFKKSKIMILFASSFSIHNSDSRHDWMSTNIMASCNKTTNTHNIMRFRGHKNIGRFANFDVTKISGLRSISCWTETLEPSASGIRPITSNYSYETLLSRPFEFFVLWMECFSHIEYPLTLSLSLRSSLWTVEKSRTKCSTVQRRTIFRFIYSNSNNFIIFDTI